MKAADTAGSATIAIDTAGGHSPTGDRGVASTKKAAADTAKGPSRSSQGGAAGSSHLQDLTPEPPAPEEVLQGARARDILPEPPSSENRTAEGASARRVTSVAPLGYATRGALCYKGASEETPVSTGNPRPSIGRSGARIGPPANGGWLHGPRARGNSRQKAGPTEISEAQETLPAARFRISSAETDATSHHDSRMIISSQNDDARMENNYSMPGPKRKGFFRR